MAATTFPSDLDIARRARLQPMPDIAARMGIGAVEAMRRRLSTIFKKQLTSNLAATRLRAPPSSRHGTGIGFAHGSPLATPTVGHLGAL